MDRTRIIFFIPYYMFRNITFQKSLLSGIILTTRFSVQAQINVSFKNAL
jgi:hypothetical protein